jgi:hypothetical protein
MCPNFCSPWCSWAFLLVYSRAKLKSSGDKASPCFRPFWEHIRLMLTYTYFEIGFISCIFNWEYCTVVPSELNHRLSWSLRIADILSNCTPIFFSSIQQIQKIWSVVDLLCQNPHCWSPIISPTYGLDTERKILDKILIEVDNSDIP